MSKDVKTLLSGIGMKSNYFWWKFNMQKKNRVEERLAFSELYFVDNVKGFPRLPYIETKKDFYASVSPQGFFK